MTVPPATIEVAAGDTLTVTTGVAVTVTVADPLLVVSAALVATTWQVLATPGAL